MHELTEVTAAILVGGLGTRLRSVVADRPKVLAEVGSRPFLAYLLDQVAEAGVRHVVLCTGYRAEQVQAAFGQSYRGMQVLYSVETEPLGTGGALRLALPMLTTGHALAMNGDSYCQADLRGLHAFHQTQAAPLTLLLTHVNDAGRFGSVAVDEQSRVTAFCEKNGLAQPGWINAGIYLFRRDVIETIPTGRSVSLEREVFPGWVGRGLQAFPCAESRFLDIGTPQSYAQAESFLQARG